MKDINERYEVENIILTMADIVIENRYLRKENARLKKMEEEYGNFLFKTARANEQASRNMVKAALVVMLESFREKEVRN